VPGFAVQALIAPQTESVIDLIGLAPCHQDLPAEARVGAQMIFARASGGKLKGLFHSIDHLPFPSFVNSKYRRYMNATS
jgi:hypothetical protein